MFGAPDSSFLSQCHQGIQRIIIKGKTKRKENQKYFILLKSGHKHKIYFPNMKLVLILKVVGKVT